MARAMPGIRLRPSGHHAEAWPQNLPVIVLSSRTTEPDMLRAFEEDVPAGVELEVAALV
jgi:hypothetical protein